jgi:TrmH family RNA methyltransferase
MDEATLTGPLAILIGGEGPGLPPSLVDAADERVTIPMHAPVESLNAAVTAALILYEARRQRHATTSTNTRQDETND